MTTNLTDLRNQLALETLDDETLDQLVQFRRETTEYHISQGNKVQAIVHNAVLSALIELQERRKAAGEPELKPANLINKFYERYLVASFKSDTERAAALGYFMAGAELQCFGEFVKYEELCGDE